MAAYGPGDPVRPDDTSEPSHDADQPAEAEEEWDWRTDEDAQGFSDQRHIYWVWPSRDNYCRVCDPAANEYSRDALLSTWRQQLLFELEVAKTPWLRPPPAVRMQRMCSADEEAAANSFVVTEAARSCLAPLMRFRLTSLPRRRALMQCSRLMINRLCILIRGDGASAQLHVANAQLHVANALGPSGALPCVHMSAPSFAVAERCKGKA